MENARENQLHYQNKNMWGTPMTRIKMRLPKYKVHDNVHQKKSQWTHLKDFITKAKHIIKDLLYMMIRTFSPALMRSAVHLDRCQSSWGPRAPAEHRRKFSMMTMPWQKFPPLLCVKFRSSTMTTTPIRMESIAQECRWKSSVICILPITLNRHKNGTQSTVRSTSKFEYLQWPLPRLEIKSKGEQKKFWCRQGMIRIQAQSIINSLQRLISW